MLPKIFTTEWYRYLATDHDIFNLLWVTFTVAISVVVISLLIAFPAAYAMARYDFRFKGLILSLFLLPMIIPPMAYGIPLAMVMYKSQVGLANHRGDFGQSGSDCTVYDLDLQPFIEQIGTNLESAAKMLGASD